MSEIHQFPSRLLDSANAAYGDDARVRLLLDLSEMLARAATLAEVADAGMIGAKRAFPDSVATILCRVADNRDDLEIFAVSSLPGQIFERWQCFPINSDAPIAHAVAHRRVIVLESPADWDAVYPHLAPLLTETGHRAQLVAPLVVGREAIGAIGIAFSEERTFGSEEIALASALGAQCAIAIERARLFDIEKNAREVAENANRVKAEFLSRLSHELRTPLGAIGGYAELIQLGIHGPVTDEQHEALRRLQASQKHINGLIDAMLEFSRIEAGVTQFDIGEIAIEETIQMCETVVAPQFQQRQIGYARVGAVSTAIVRADPEKLRQIVINLLTNAMKYTKSPGSVTLSVVEDDERVRVSVSDTGLGIDERDLELIFQPFVRIRTSSKDVPGVGLGLAISRNFARAMNADLTVESSPGKGSTFTLTLPRQSDFSPHAI